MPEIDGRRYHIEYPPTADGSLGFGIIVWDDPPPLNIVDAKPNIEAAIAYVREHYPLSPQPDLIILDDITSTNEKPMSDEMKAKMKDWFENVFLNRGDANVSDE